MFGPTFTMQDRVGVTYNHFSHLMLKHSHTIKKL
jgi:hypothetical protein